MNYASAKGIWAALCTFKGISMIRPNNKIRVKNRKGTLRAIRDKSNIGIDAICREDVLARRLLPGFVVFARLLTRIALQTI